jgi:hypothetical protein
VEDYSEHTIPGLEDLQGLAYLPYGVEVSVSHEVVVAIVAAAKDYAAGLRTESGPDRFGNPRDVFIIGGR